MTGPDPEVSVQQAADAAAAGLVLLVDVREDEEWAAGRAPGAIHARLSSLRADDVPGDRPVVAVCRSGNRSGKAAAQLAQAGLRVSNMAGGMTAWAAAGLPVVRDDGSPGEIA
ncbi:MAG: rhodanese-like domain-containing protein [Mycobacteriales bacterium]|nr:rhodanese-like domain-containing protein [Mycobacteriales bacterium]